jgi:hypothetical protein
MEPRFAFDFSKVRIHADGRAAEAASSIDARAFTSGSNIAFGAGEYVPQTVSGRGLLSHELAHVAQQSTGRVRPTAGAAGLAINDDAALEQEADRMGERGAPTSWALAPSALRAVVPPSMASAVQRKVRIDGGKTKVNETEYQTGAKSAVGSRYLVKTLIADGAKRSFTDVTELENFANGATDYIGDVMTASDGKYWYRLPPKTMTVLGEEHRSASGNFEDVVVGLRTARFKYEPFNETVDVAGITTPGTQTRIDQINKQYVSSGQVNSASGFKPELENAVIKAMTGAALTREFIAEGPSGMGPKRQEEWGKRASTSD